MALLQQGHANVKVHLSFFRLLSKFTLQFLLLSHLKNRNNLSNPLAAYRQAKILNTSCEDRSGTHNLCVKHCSIFYHVNFIPVGFQRQHFRRFDEFLLKQFSVQIGK